jgi:hypothetical protein
MEKSAMASFNILAITFVRMTRQSGDTEERLSEGVIWLDQIHVHDTCRMSITPKAIQDLLDELEASKQSRLRGWNVLQRLRLLLSEMGNVAIPLPARKTFDAKGEILEHALAKSLHLQERGDQKSLFFRTPPSKRNAKAIIRTLYSIVERVGSGRESDSESIQCADIETNSFRR